MQRQPVFPGESHRDLVSVAQGVLPALQTKGHVGRRHQSAFGSAYRKAGPNNGGNHTPQKRNGLSAALGLSLANSSMA
jgi:hypothetical protein